MTTKEIAKPIFVAFGCIAFSYQALKKFRDASMADGLGSTFLEAALGLLFAGVAVYLAVSAWQLIRDLRF